jgi:hypothetical protein
MGSFSSGTELSPSSVPTVSYKPDRSLVAGYTFLSDGWWSLVHPSSFHLTTASSSLVRSTVPISPVGFPKLLKPSTRSPGLSFSSAAGGSASGGFLARSASGVAPGCGSGGWAALRSFGVSLSVRRKLLQHRLGKNAWLTQTAQFRQLSWQSGHTTVLASGQWVRRTQIGLGPFVTTSTSNTVAALWTVPAIVISGSETSGCCSASASRRVLMLRS